MMEKSRERHYMEYGSVYLASKASMHWRTKPKFVGRRRRGSDNYSKKLEISGLDSGNVAAENARIGAIEAREFVDCKLRSINNKR